MKPALLICLFALSAACAPLRVLIVTGETDLPYHDWRSTTPFLREALAATGRFEVRVAEEPRGLTAAALSNYDAVVLNYNGPRWGAAPEAALENFVRSGKGLVAFHGVSYGYPMGMELGPKNRWVRSTKPGAAWPAYIDMLGSDWEPDKIGHAVRHAFTVKLSDREHPITRGMTPEFTANDELYHRMAHRPGIRVLANAFSDRSLGGTGNEEPIAWTVSFGKGRVFHTTLGHDTSAMYNEGFLTMFARALEWAASGAVTLPAHIPLLKAPKDPVRVLVATGGHAYDTSFYQVFEGGEDFVWSHAVSQREAFRPGMEERWDVLALYDMHNEIGEEEKRSLERFVAAGRGVVSLHHAIVDYTSWPWWYENVIGGKYFEKPHGPHAAATYKHDVPLVARTVRKMANHPVVRGVGDLVIFDEAYKGMWHSPGIKVLMETDSPLNDRPVVYVGPGENSKAVYIQFGHGPEAHAHPGFRKLVHNAILWAAGRAK